MGKKFKFTAETRIDEALKLGERVQAAFKAMGLKCIECPAAEVECLRHAALYHEKSLDAILRELNRLDIEAPEPPPKP